MTDFETTERSVRLDLRYDGTDFSGWQMQKGQRTVEEVLIRAIDNILGEGHKLRVAGRTDAGVHAEHQVAQLCVNTTMTCRQLLRAFNSRLPEDVAVTSVAEVPEKWDARRSARRRTYRYSIWNSRVRDPLLRRFTHWVAPPLDFESMREAAEVFVGRHDFNAFRSEHCDARNPVRTMTASLLRREGNRIDYWIEGHAFLRHMVRTIAGTLIEVGRGKLTPRDVRSILEVRDRKAAGPTAPARGLTLVRVTYAGENSSVPEEPCVIEGGSHGTEQHGVCCHSG